MRDDRQRLDKWLWFARFAKTRPLAVRLVDDGHVRINGRRAENPALGLKRGDVLTLALAHQTVVVRLLDLGIRRGPFEKARLLYEPVGADASGALPLAEEEPNG